MLECYLPIAWPATMTKLCLSREILCNTSFFSQLVKLIFTILPQHQIAKLSRYIFLKCPGKTLIATQKLNAHCCEEQLTDFVFCHPPLSPFLHVLHCTHWDYIWLCAKEFFFFLHSLFLLCPWNSDLQALAKCKPNILQRDWGWSDWGGQEVDLLQLDHCSDNLMFMSVDTSLHCERLMALCHVGQQHLICLKIIEAVTSNPTY